MTIEEKATAYAEKITLTTPLGCATWGEIKKSYANAYLAGATEALASQWVSVEERLPEDGTYITALKTVASPGKIHIDIAPWREGEYQGSLKMGVYVGTVKVLAYMLIPIPPTEGGEEK